MHAFVYCIVHTAETDHAVERRGELHMYVCTYVCELLPSRDALFQYRKKEHNRHCKDQQKALVVREMIERKQQGEKHQENLKGWKGAWLQRLTDHQHQRVHIYNS